MMKHMTMAFFFAMLVLNAPAQVTRTYSVGDTLPNLPLGSYLMNYPKPSATLHDFRDRYVILDFWETHCQPCINGLPKLQALQDKYRDKLQIIAITRNSEENVRKLFARSEVIKNTSIRLPFAVEDTTLQDVFPHLIIPHVVVIDPEGVVLGITHGDEITDKNIASMISGTKKDWIPKDDRPTLAVSSGESEGKTNSLLVWSSSLKKGNRGFGHIVYYDEPKTVKNIQIETYPIDIYYKMFSLFSIGVMGNANIQRIYIDVTNPSVKMRYANKDLPVPFFPGDFPYLHYANRMEYASENIFSYSATFPPSTPDSLVLDYVFRDLNKTWPIKGEIVREIKTCYVIKGNVDAERLLKSGGGDPIVPFDQTTVRIQNQPISELVKVLGWFSDGPPIFDATGITSPIDITVDFSESELRNPKRGLIVNNPLDITVLERELARYGLYLVREEREVNMLRIYDEVPGNEKTASRPLK